MLKGEDITWTKNRPCNESPVFTIYQKCENETATAPTTTTETFRSLQCSTLNTRLFGERKFDWEFKPSKIGKIYLLFHSLWKKVKKPPKPDQIKSPEMFAKR